MQFEEIQVECYSGYKANERPTAFHYRDRRWEIAEVEDRWYEGGVTPGSPDIDYFKVRTTEGEVFILRYLSQLDAWSIQV
ncbi:MAG: hypothetical protein JW902_09930 [Syntrophaceae bacterium]|nr:hypothetical protein [Syntrophaceae bacterium]